MSAEEARHVDMRRLSHVTQPRFHGEPSSSNSVADPNVFSPEYIMYLRVWRRVLVSWEAMGGVRKRVGAR